MELCCHKIVTVCQNKRKVMLEQKNEYEKYLSLQETYQKQSDAYQTWLQEYISIVNNFHDYAREKIEPLKAARRKQDIEEIQKKLEAVERQIKTYKNILYSQKSIINVNDGFFVCIINGIPYNLVTFYADIMLNDLSSAKITALRSSFSEFANIPVNKVTALFTEIKDTGSIPHEFNCETITEENDRLFKASLETKVQKTVPEVADTYSYSRGQQVYLPFRGSSITTVCEGIGIAAIFLGIICSFVFACVTFNTQAGNIFAACISFVLGTVSSIITGTIFLWMAAVTDKLDTVIWHHKNMM